MCMNFLKNIRMGRSLSEKPFNMLTVYVCNSNTIVRCIFLTYIFSILITIDRFHIDYMSHDDYREWSGMNDIEDDGYLY